MFSKDMDTLAGFAALAVSVVILSEEAVKLGITLALMGWTLNKAP